MWTHTAVSLSLQPAEQHCLRLENSQCQVQLTSLHRHTHSTKVKQTSLFTLDISFITSLPGDNLRNSWQLVPLMFPSWKVSCVPSAWLGEDRDSGLRCFSASLSVSALGPLGASSTEHTWQVSVWSFTLLSVGLPSSGALVLDCSIWETNQQ